MREPSGMWDTAFFGDCQLSPKGVMGCWLRVTTDLAEEIRSLDIDVVAPVEILLGRALEVLQDHDTRTRNQNVDFAEFVHCLGDHVFNVLDAAGVAFDEEGFLSTNLLGNILGRVGV